MGQEGSGGPRAAVAESASPWSYTQSREGSVRLGSAARGRSAGPGPAAFLIPRYLLHLHVIKNLLQRKAQSPQNPYSNRVSALQPWSAGLDRHGGGVFGEGINRKLTLSIQRESKQCPMPPGPGSRILKSELPQPSQGNPGTIPRLQAGF